MIGFQRTFYALTRWFEERRISTDGLTIILNFVDRDAAVQFDAAMQRDLEGVLLHTGGQSLDVREFTVLGVKVKIESPAHGQERTYYTPSTELQFRYDIRAALGWNDKTSLDILVDGVLALKRSHDDLLAAVEGLLPDGWGDDGTMDHMPGIKFARAALAKGKGR